MISPPPFHIEPFNYIWKNWLNLLRDETLIEDWHEVGATGEPAYENSWTLSSSKHFGFRELKSINSVQIHGRIVPGTETNATTVFTLPAGYRPLVVYTYIITTPVTGGAGGLIVVDVDGTIQVYNLDTGSSIYDVNIIFPLDI